MDTAAAPAPRPLSQQRPTQAYYVPRRLLDSGRGPTIGTKEVEKVQPKTENEAPKKSPKKSPPGDRSQSPNEKKENVKPTKKQPQHKTPPRPLMAEIVPKPDSLKEKKYSRPRNNPPQAQQALIQKVAGLTVSEPRVVSPKNGSQSLSLPNRFSPKTEAQKECICDRPETHVVCQRCGYECLGRVVRVCDQHPMKLSLMDIRECPNPICRSFQITDIPSFSLSISQPS